MNRRRDARREIAALLAATPSDFGGGCSLEKAHVLAWLIRRGRLHSTCDIGVYRGRSLLPQALAHSKYTGGVAFGIDPFSRIAALQEDNLQLKPELDQWSAATDFDALYLEVCSTLRLRGLDGNVELLRMTSSQAVEVLRSRSVRFGLVHVDGNHDTTEVLEDVESYLPLLQAGGFLVLDDISWDSVKPAVRFARDHLVELYVRVDAQNDYAVFWNGTSRLRAFYLALALRWIGLP